MYYHGLHTCICRGLVTEAEYSYHCRRIDFSLSLMLLWALARLLFLYPNERLGCLNSFTATSFLATGAMLRVGARPFRFGRWIMTQSSQALIQLPQHEQHRQQRHAISGLLPLPPLQLPTQCSQSRSYISEMRKSAFEANILRLLRDEIQYELDRSPPHQVLESFLLVPSIVFVHKLNHLLLLI